MVCTSFIGLAKAALSIPFYKVIVFQKVMSKYHLVLLKYARSLGKLTVFDIDDAPSFKKDAIANAYFKKMLSNSHKVMAGSPALLDMVNQISNNAILLPSSVNLNYYPRAKKEHREVISIGWIGNGKYYKKDLIDILTEPLTKLAAKQPVIFKVIGGVGQTDLEQAFDDIPGLTLDWIDQINWSDPMAISNALDHFDIGVYPLLETEFNKFKCGFKALEYMAKGIPVVSSRVSVNKDIILDNVTGYLVHTPQEWEDTLTKLANDPSLRKKMGESGRERVENLYSTEVVSAMFTREVFSE